MEPMNDSGVVQVGLSSLVGGFPQPWVLGGDQRPEMQPADFDSFRVTWAAPRGQSLAEWFLIDRWLSVHGVVDGYPLDVREPCVASHPVLGDVLVFVGPQRDGRGRAVLAFGSTSEYAERVCVQPLGMPPPAVLRERGEARARELGLRLPVAALLSGAHRG